MAHGVRQRFLHDPVRRQLDARRHRADRALACERHLDPRGAHFGEQFVEAVEAWLGGALRRRVPRAQAAQQSTELAETLLTDGLDALQRSAHPVVVGASGLRRLRLDHHDAHAVGEHVVDLAGDSRSLHFSCESHLLLAFMRQLHRARLQRSRREASLAHQCAEDPGGREEARVRRHR